MMTSHVFILPCQRHCLIGLCIAGRVNRIPQGREFNKFQISSLLDKHSRPNLIIISSGNIVVNLKAPTPHLTYDRVVILTHEGIAQSMITTSYRPLTFSHKMNHPNKINGLASASLNSRPARMEMDSNSLM